MGNYNEQIGKLQLITPISRTLMIAQTATDHNQWAEQNKSSAPSYPSAGRLLRKNCSAFEIVVGNGGDMPRRASGMQIVSEARPERSQ